MALQPSQPQFTVRAQAHQTQRVGIRLWVDQHQIGLGVAIPVIFPVAGQGVVAVARLWRLVVQQGRRDGVKVVIERSLTSANTSIASAVGVP